MLVIKKKGFKGVSPFNSESGDDIYNEAKVESNGDLDPPGSFINIL